MMGLKTKDYKIRQKHARTHKIMTTTYFTVEILMNKMFQSSAA